MPIDDRQAASVAAYILPRLYDVIARYDLRRYPPDPYATFRERFAALQPDNPCIADAMIWKWGKWNAVGYPTAHARLIEEIAEAWQPFVASGAAAAPADTFDWWTSRLGRPTTYTTNAWITHLVHHRSGQPLVDQHNFRAMNHFLSELDPDTRLKRRPSNRRDIERLADFMRRVLAQLPGIERCTLDRFMIMYGKYHVPRGRPGAVPPPSDTAGSRTGTAR